MSSKGRRNVHIPKAILDVLKELDVNDYHVEPRRKHAYLVVDGQRVGVLSYSGATKYRTLKNTVSRIRRQIEGRTAQ